MTDKHQDENVGTEALIRGEEAAVLAGQRARKARYGRKMHKKKSLQGKVHGSAETSQKPNSRFYQKSQMKREMIEHAQKQQEKAAANGFGSVGRKFVDKAEDLTGRIGEFLVEHIAENPLAALMCLGILLLVLVLSGGVSSCSMMAGGVQNVAVVTSYTADNDQILAVDGDYAQMEADLQYTIDNIESEYPGYDEYRVTADNIGHNAYQLAAVLTVLYEDYTREEVQATLHSIFDAQYELTLREIVETRGDEDDEYEYYILVVRLTNATMDTVIRNMGLTTDQMQRYEILLETMGNKADLFADDIYSNVTPGDYPDYDIPPEALTNQRFANMIREGEKYLGYPYVWGGASPSTSFDCSGFVSWVINHCGNGWSVGRQTANGLLGCCTRVSRANAQPGDLIFFQGTYSTNGASHVGIYVGNGMMLHCGNPIQYTSINTNYWQNHFYTFGRIR